MKRWLVRICVLLLLGATVNIAVAWGLCAFRERPGFFDANAAKTEATEEQAARLFAVTGVDREFVDWSGGAFVQRTFGFTVVWLWYGSGIAHEDCDVSAGLPLRCLWGIRQEIVGSTGHERYGMLECTFLPGEVCDLPYLLIWPGFAINTVFYAFMLWLLFAGPFVLRRRRRIRRGLCLKCAYDLRGTEAKICPECGATR